MRQVEQGIANINRDEIDIIALFLNGVLDAMGTAR
jgi:hypothetical protein